MIQKSREFIPSTVPALVNLETFFKELVNSQISLEEENLWYIFHCLALACSVCDRGTEDLSKPGWNYTIVNRDIGLANGIGS